MFDIKINLGNEFTGIEIIDALELASKVSGPDDLTWGLSVWEEGYYAYRDGQYIPLSREIAIHPMIRKQRKKFFFFGPITETRKRILNPVILLKFSNVEEPVREIRLSVNYVWTIFGSERNAHFSISSPEDPHYKENVQPYLEKILQNLTKELG